MTTPTPSPTALEYTPMSPLEVAELRLKIAAGHPQTALECARFVLSIRASFLAGQAKTKALPTGKAKAKPSFDVDFDL